MREIRWHGRGGQGAKTAAILLAKIAASAGKHIQAFPEYGPERMGAPVLAYTRISDQIIHQHCQVEFPDYVVVLDPTLIKTVDVTANLKEGGVLLINTKKAPEDLRAENQFADSLRIFTLDADLISREELGKSFPNTPMLGAFNRVSELMDKEDFRKQSQNEFSKKFSGKKELVEGNVNAVNRAFEEVRGL